MVYAIQVEQNERIALALVTRGADVGLLLDARERFDMALVAEPEGDVLPSEQVALRRALGVA